MSNGNEIVGIAPRRIGVAVREQDPERDARHTHVKAGTVRTDYPGSWSTYASMRHVTDMAVASKDEVWLATWGGVIHWQPNSHRCTRYSSEHGLPGNATGRVVLASDGTVWAAGIERGLSYLDADGLWRSPPIFDAPIFDSPGMKIIALAARPSSGLLAILFRPPGNYILLAIERDSANIDIVGIETKACVETRTLIETGNGSIWLGNAGGLHRRAPNGTIETWQHTFPLRVNVLAPAAGGTYWVGTDWGLFRFSPEEGRFEQGDDWPRLPVRDFAQNNYLWVLTSGGFGRLINNAWQPAAESPEGRLNAIVPAIDPHKVWLGGSRGVHCADLSDYRPAIDNAADDAAGNMVQTLAVSGNKLRIGTPRGLVERDNHEWREYYEHRELRDVRALCPDFSDDTLWVGTWFGGLRQLIQGEFLPGSPLDTQVTALVRKGDTLWMASIDRLYVQRQADPEWQPVIMPPSTLPLPAIQALCIQESAGETIAWVGTTAGLFRYTVERDQWDTADEPMKNQAIHALTSDDKESVWAGSDAGLHIFDANGLQPPIPGFPSKHTVTALLITASDLWVGTDRGLWHHPLTAGETHKYNTQNSGLASNHITALAHDGETVWIGTTGGLTSLNDLG